MLLGMIGIVRVLIIKMRNAPMPCRIFLFLADSQTIFQVFAGVPFL
jgi:hypothetical protein